MSLVAIVALGSNLGDRQAHLAAGLKALCELGQVTPSTLIMETKDESGLGPDYLNTVARVETVLNDPCQLLESLLRIELRLGRDRLSGKNAPRTLDLDLIEVDQVSGFWEWPAPPELGLLGAKLTLELPHPRAEQRVFVQEPLRCLAFRH
jgi:2-amino-4-hydroxy-6-hydroxymethyldihydropteridine diphosphokinase